MNQKILIILFTLLSIVSYSQSIEIIPKSQVFIESFPGEKIIVAFLVKNRSFNKLSVVTELGLPKEWEIITPDSPFELEVNQGDVRIISFFIPRDAQPGTYTLTYIVKGVSDTSLSSSYSFQIKVFPGINIDVSVLTSPEYVYAGEDIITSFTITNKTGSDLHLEFFLYSNKKFPMYLLDSQTPLLDLAANESKVVRVVVQTDPDVAESTKHDLELSFFLLDEGWEQKPVIITSTVQIFPREAIEKIVYHTLPLELTLRHSEQVYETWEGDFEFHLSGYGYLDEEKTHYLDVTLNKRVQIPEDSFIDDEDEYAFKYTSPITELYLGDHFYTVSPLIEEYCYGRGVMGKITAGSFSLSALYHESQWDIPPENHLGGILDVSLKDDPARDDFNYKLALSCFSSIDNSIIAGVYQQFKPMDAFSFSCDTIAGSHFDNNWNIACNVDGKWTGNWLELGFDFIYAQPDCPGEYDDTLSIDTSIGTQFFNKSLEITSGFTYEKENIHISDDFILAMLEKKARLGLSYQLKKTYTYISLDWEISHSLDQSDPSVVEDIRNNFTIFFNQPIGIVTCYLLAFLEIRKDIIFSETKFQQQYIASISYKPGEKMEYTLSCNFSDSAYLGIDLEVDAGLAYQFNEVNKALVNVIYDYIHTNYEPEQIEHAVTLSIGYSRKLNIPVSGKKME